MGQLLGRDPGQLVLVALRGPLGWASGDGAWVGGPENWNPSGRGEENALLQKQETAGSARALAHAGLLSPAGGALSAESNWSAEAGANVSPRGRDGGFGAESGRLVTRSGPVWLL